MATGDRVFMAKESTSQEILSKTNQIIEAGKEKPKRYGMKINRIDSNPETRVTYLYDAVGMTPAGMNFTEGGFDYGDWGEIWFVKNNRPVMLKTDGTVDYELDHENHALKLDGTASDIANTSYGGNAMSEIPLIWVKRYSTANFDYVIFCEVQYDDTYKAYAHTDADGNILPVTYFPMYEGAIINNRLRSLSGQSKGGQSEALEMGAAKENGDRWGILSFSEVNLMYEMCTMISRSTNSQEKFGGGYSNTSTTYLTTGRLNGEGQFYGYNSQTGAVKMFYCENFFGNRHKRIRGLLLIDGVYYIKPVPPYASNGEGYINTEMTVSGTSGGYISKMELVSDIGRIPTVASGSETTYECDGLSFNKKGVMVARFGGHYTSKKACGLSCWNVSGIGTSASTENTTSLSCKPPVDSMSSDDT